ncbi:hypothetical protein BKA65DRAFT_198591 [Rhexocercosporidium sp. MPI-PUGE-AT-0058]|nr:hypothetical protein BKA65DRAFT_198591 [Rhexocercosporidium sp. MPI-PUGE-AT-0058]
MLDTCQLDSCSEITSSAKISVGFETDSTESDDRAGDEENHLVTLPSASDVLRAMEDLQFGSVFVEEEAVFRTVLTPVMETLLDSIMTDFWTIFNQEWSANLRKCGGTPSSSSSVSMNAQAASQGPQQTTVSNSQKRLRDDADRPEDEDCNDPKRHRSSVNPSEIADFNLKLACPYRKHNPRTYNHCTKAWRLCALTSFGTIARLKGHLYRHHRIFQCERCKELFGDRAKLQTHHMAIKACEVTETKSHDGITCAMECQLKSRKKSSGNETQEESWKVIYAILFPMQAIPSPYFEMIHEETPRSPNSSLLSSYEEFSRQQLPRVFRSALETAIGTERQLAEDRLRNRLISMIQECQDRVFSLYRSQQSDASSTPPPSQQSGEGPGILQSSYGAPPYQDDGSSMPNVPNSTAYSSLAPSNESRASDSGYSSEYPALKSSTDNFSHERSAIPTDVTRHPFDECIADSTDNPQNFDPFENYLNTSGNCPLISTILLHFSRAHPEIWTEWIRTRTSRMTL